MFSSGQPMESKKICDLSASLKKSHHELSCSLFGLKLAQRKWSPELAAYLREEDPGIPTNQREFDALVERVEGVELALRKLKRHTSELCFDLERVGRGESFSV